MKKLILTLLFFTYFTLFGQQKTFNLEWNGTKELINSALKEKIPYFEGENYNFDAVNNRLIYSVVLEDGVFVDEKSLKVESVNYENINENQLGVLSKSTLPVDSEVSVKSFYARNSIKNILNFYPIIREGNAIKRIKSIKVSYKTGQSTQRKSRYSTASIERRSSVLKSGNWFKFAVEKTGVYRISKAFLQSLGVPESVDPRTIKIYGSGGKMLPVSNIADFEKDLKENAIKVVGEQDGVFDDEDYILFYAVGVDQWDRDNLTHLNLFEDKAYCFLTYDGDFGKRIRAYQQPSGGAVKIYDTYNAIAFHEHDLNNIAQLGRKWFGERFNIQNKQDFSFSLLNLNSSFPIKVNINTASASYGNSSFGFELNGNYLGGINFASIQGSTVKAYETFFSKEITINSANPTVSLTYNNGGVPNAEGYLDYIQIEYKADLSGGNKQFGFYNTDLAQESGIVQYQVKNASQLNEIWYVNDIENIQNISLNSANIVSFKVMGGAVRKFHALSGSDYYSPIALPNSRVVNQDVKGSVFSEGDVDYLIITNEQLRGAAERLANFHRSGKHRYKVKVVELEKIYNEFSSGKQDVAAIRNFIRYVYENASDESRRLRFVNLFGDTSFDYKDRIQNNTNIVPTFYGMNKTREVVNSGANFSMYTTFMSDDYYGQMDVGEGEMTNSAYGIDIAVGRMLAKNTEEANAMVSKVMDYNQKETQGRWRNNIIAMADDVDRESDYVLELDSDEIVKEIIEERPYFNPVKIYLDAYVQDVSAGGNRYFKAQKDFIAAIESGALYINYLGHGGEDALTQERVFTIEDANNLKNYKKYPLFTTITCEFTRFDTPLQTTGGEAMYKNKEGGAIALVATTREIGIATGRQINKRFSKELFRSKTDLTIAEALMNTKNATTTRDKNVVSYIGDPALELAIPNLKVELTTVNDEDVNTFDGELQALGYVKIGGEIQDENNNLIHSFNGNLAVQVFDKFIDKKTLGNDGVTSNGELLLMDFTILGETVFRGNASVNQGKFAFDFILPKDVKIAVGEGRISFYANNEAIDYTGNNDRLKIGGLNKDAPEDKTPPVIKLYMDNESFISGGMTDNNPVFLAFLEDESGINTSSGIGHDLVAVLDDNEREPIVMNDYYETEPDNFRKGKITYPLKDLAPGMHTLLFKAWDVYNNLSSAELQFVVAEQEDLKLEHVLNYPNPFVSYTEFWFTHNRPYETLDVQVQIMTVAGRIVKTINQQVTTENNLCREIVWDGRDDFGDRIGKGVYIYKLTVRSNQTGHQAEKIEKLVVL
ncbi:type IX secretion system sortase PorU [Myroides indicus]|nr:type IX secretion system sortase PorU [Myroides indicus]